jgi:hypothetical protein
LQPNDVRSLRAAVRIVRFAAGIDRPPAKMPEKQPDAITTVGLSAQCPSNRPLRSSGQKNSSRLHRRLDHRRHAR